MFLTLIRIALRNLLVHRVKSLIVGAILVFGTLLVLLGAALLGSIEASMAASVVGSVSGHLQISGDNGKDPLVLFPGPLDGNEIGTIADFPRVRTALEALPEVKAVVPQGMDYAMIFAANLIDTKLARIRELQRKGDTAAIAPVRDHVRRIVELLHEDLLRVRKVFDMDKDDVNRRGVEAVHEAAQPAFWADFDSHIEAKMEFLENRVAQMAIGEDVLFIRYMGTDVWRFAEAFSKFEMIRGSMIPKGQRGLLLNSLFYEEMFKHKAARRLDKMRDKIAEGALFVDDDELREWRRMNMSQYKEITWQLDDPAQARVVAALQAGLASKETDVDKLVQTLMDMDDANFAARFQLFYDKIAPEVRLYRADVGETLTIRATSQGGYMSSVNVRIYGVFRFEGMDRSPLSGGVNVMDIMSFRDLYGHVTAEQKDEIAALQKRTGIKEIAAEDAESALFGEGAAAEEPAAADAVAPAALASETTAVAFDEFASLDMGEGAKRWSEKLFDVVYRQEDIDGGVVRNAAIVLHPDVSVEQGRRAVEAAIASQRLGLKVMDWRQASGMLGQFVAVIYAVLLVAILGVFGVALLVINNSMVLSTIERTREIGTIRAIGGSRRFILWMFLVESLVLGAVFGGLGVALGAGVVAWLGAVGIPAPNDTMTFVFGGQRLYPWLSSGQVAFALGLVVIVTIISTIYPTLLAVRVTPLEAMQPKED